MNNAVKDFSDLIKAERTVVLFPHENPDGDAIGSCAALCLALRSIGREAYVALDEKMPHNLDFMEESCRLDIPKAVIDGEFLGVLVDCGHPSRIGKRAALFEKATRTACVDHHLNDGREFAFDFYVIDPKSAATGELAFLIIKELGGEVTLPVANALFTAITTDTGNFQHSNTTKRTHEITAQLYDAEGFDPKAVSVLIYDRQSAGSVKMKANVLENLEISEDGKLAIGHVTQELLKETGCDMSESDGIINAIMSLDGVEIGVLLKESGENRIKVSLRAKTYVNVAEIAQILGGGGHVRAAGATVEGTADEVRSSVKDLCMKALNADPA